jgi:NitT/TauT family transport system permease protein
MATLGRTRRLGLPAVSTLADYGLPILSFVVGVILWELLFNLFDVPAYLFPSPSAIVDVFFSGKIDWPKHTLITVREAVVGAVLGIILGYALALVITLSTTLSKILMPYVVALQVLPKVAIAPIIYILLGFSDTSKILLIVILTFFPIVINVSTGLTAVDRNLVHLLQSLGASNTTIFYKVRLPNSMPYFFDALKIAISGALVGAIVAEFVSSNSGLGFLILNSQYTFNTVAAFGAFTILTVLGLMLYGGVVLLGRILMPWYRSN